MADIVVVAEGGPGDATATAALGPERVGRDGLDVAGRAVGDDQLLVVDQVLDVDLAVVDGQLAAARRGELLAHVGQLGADDLAQLHVVAEDRLDGLPDVVIVVDAEDR